MPIEKVPGETDPVWNLQLLLGITALALYGWWWASFSGPFRWLIDAQLRLFNRYSEGAAGLALAIALVPVLWAAGALLGRIWPYRSARAVDAAVAMVVAAASLAALFQASHLWQQAEHMPSLNDPLQVIDLDRLGDTVLPTGHVRLIGVPDRARQVLIRYVGRRALGSYWEAWVPVVARNSRGPAVPARIIASYRDPDQAKALRGVTDDPQGMLLAGEMDNRTAYEVRHKGLVLAERTLVLYPDDVVQFEKQTNAILLTALVLLSWLAGAYSWFKGRRSSQTATVDSQSYPASAQPRQVSTVTAESTSIRANTDADLAVPEAEQAPGSLLSRLAFGAVIIAILAASLLWNSMGYLPGRVLLWGFAATAMTFVAGLFFVWLGMRDDADASQASPLLRKTAPMADLRTPPGAAVLCVLRDEPISTNSYKRVDVDGVRIAVLKANRYVVVALTPGSHTLAVNTRLSLASDVVERFDAAEGAVVIYRMVVPFFGSMRLERTADIVATREALRRLKAVEP